MECPSNWEYKTLIEELSKGMEQANQLKDHRSSTSSGVQDLFIQRIISSFEKSLLILNLSGSATPQCQPSPPLAVSGLIESSISVVNSPRSEILNTSLKNQQKPKRPCASKKRKTMASRTEQVRVNAHHGLEGPSDDNFSWRKYGQKDILGAKYPRNYYRCTYRHGQNCWATKHVQRSDDDPTLFDVTYKGTHTCYQATNNSVVAPPPLSPEKQELKHANEVLINFREKLRVNTWELDNDTNNNSFVFPSTMTYTTEGENQFYQTTNPNDEPFLGTYVSPTTPESDYFSMSNEYMNNNSLGGASNWQCYESELNDIIISANASLNNLPNGRLDIPIIDPTDSDLDFPFNMSALFT